MYVAILGVSESVNQSIVCVKLPKVCHFCFLFFRTVSLMLVLFVCLCVPSNIGLVSMIMKLNVIY